MNKYIIKSPSQIELVRKLNYYSNLNLINTKIVLSKVQTYQKKKFKIVMKKQKFHEDLKIQKSIKSIQLNL